MYYLYFLAVFASNNSQSCSENSESLTPPAPPTSVDDNQSPLTKKSFFKRNIVDGMDR